MVRVDGLRLAAKVVEPVDVVGKLGNAAHEVAVWVARLPVAVIIDVDDRADVPVTATALRGTLYRLVVQLRKLRLTVLVTHVYQLIPIPAYWAKKETAIVINLGLNVFELELREASLALNHGHLLVNRGIVARSDLDQSSAKRR